MCQIVVLSILIIQLSNTNARAWDPGNLLPRPSLQSRMHFFDTFPVKFWHKQAMHTLSNVHCSVYHASSTSLHSCMTLCICLCECSSTCSRARVFLDC